MNFEEYLISKRIDSASFQVAEPLLWESWKSEFEQLHPASFTAQKLYLINPIRRKYTLKEVPALIVKQEAVPPASNTPSNAVNPETTESKPDATKAAKPTIPRPVFKPKPKMNG